ncbi:MAG TPA: SusC/RagA family TonB-linked outer membrane protein [Gemmatimonadaceae bacterium]|nr:SusC/RagA family TonB-linked outer membrane protein [Gemmatimonadaceae bacterium]
MRSVLVLIGLLLGSVFPAAAQTRTVTGTVTDAQTGQPLEGARVSVRGTTLSTATGASGRFTLGNVPAGDVTLTVRRIGSNPADIRLSSGQNEVTTALTRDPLRLAEVVITGQATAVERRNLANAVATVSGEEVSRVSAQTVEQALQGKVPGASIQANSGAPGGGMQMRLRGVTSINAGSEPLYVVDGVVLSNVAIPSNQNAVTKSASGSNPALTQDGQVNRIADLNPNDIENIEVLKGASASAIYGSRASNGVVIITTRRGRAGERRVNATQRIGVSKISNTLGSRTFNTLAEATAAWGASAADFYQQGVVFDHEEELAGRTPVSSESVVDFSGGDNDTRYFASGLWKEDGGIIKNTGYGKQAVRANLDQDLSSRLNLSLQTSATRSLAQRGLTNNDNAGVSWWMVFPFTPSFLNLRQNPDGTFPPNRFGNVSNPLQTAALMDNDEKVNRSIAAGRLTLTAIQRPSYSLTFIANGGADHFSQENSLLFPPELQFEPIDDGQPGTALLSNSNNLNLNVGTNAVFAYAPVSGLFTATTSVGVNGSSRDLRVSRIVSRNLVGGLGIVGAGTDVQVRELRQRVEDFGVFAQEEVLALDERLLLTAGINADRSSANSDTEKFFFYPKFSGSFRFPQPFPRLDELKLRAAYGQSGNQPLFGQKFTPLSAVENIAGLSALVVPVQGPVGSSDLRPERQREFEAGVDLTLAGGRGAIELTGFRKDVSDLLLQRTLAPSSGFGVEIFNGGELRTTGVEIGVNLVPIQTADADWIFRTSYASTRSKIVSLPVPPFRAGGFGTALGAFEISEGSSATQIVGNDSLPDGSTVVRKIGDANPDFNMSFVNDLRFRAFRLYGLVDWQSGGSIINLTKFLYDLGQNTADYADPITVGTLETTKGANRLRVFGRQTAVYVEDASFVKLREVTLSFAVPPTMVSRFGRGVQTAEVSFSGRNLLTFTDYTGMDPEVSNFGNQQIARNIDVAPFPPSRSYWLSVSLGF